MLRIGCRHVELTNRIWSVIEDSKTEDDVKHAVEKVHVFATEILKAQLVYSGHSLQRLKLNPRFEVGVEAYHKPRRMLKHPEHVVTVRTS